MNDRKLFRDDMGISYEFSLIAGKISKADIRNRTGCSEKVFITFMSRFVAKNPDFGKTYQPFLRQRGVPVSVAKRILEEMTSENATITII